VDQPDLRRAIPRFWRSCPFAGGQAVAVHGRFYFFRDDFLRDLGLRVTCEAELVVRAETARSVGRARFRTGRGDLRWLPGWTTLAGNSTPIVREGLVAPPADAPWPPPP